MPAVAVVAGAMAASAGAAALAAGVTGLAALSAGAMVVGGALTVIGTVSGNQKLAKIGGILSLAGGVGTMASNAANASSAAASTTEAASGAASTAGEVAASAAEAAGGVATEAVNLAGTETFALPEVAEAAASAGSGAGEMALNAAAPAAETASNTGLLGEELAKTATTNPATEVVKEGLGAEAASPLKASAESATQTGGSLDAIDPEMQKLLRQQTNAQAGTNFFDQDPSMLSKVQAWVKDNPKLAEMALSGAKGIAGAVPSDKDKQMMEYYKANADKLKRQAIWSNGRMA